MRLPEHKIKLKPKQVDALYELHYMYLPLFGAHKSGHMALLAEHLKVITARLLDMLHNGKKTLKLETDRAVAFVQIWSLHNVIIDAYTGNIVREIIGTIDQQRKSLAAIEGPEAQDF